MTQLTRVSQLRLSALALPRATYHLGPKRVTALSLAPFAGRLRAPRRGLPGERAQQPADPQPLLGGVGKVVQVPAARPHQRVLRRENRHLLCLAGYVIFGLSDMFWPAAKGWKGVASYGDYEKAFLSRILDVRTTS